MTVDEAFAAVASHMVEGLTHHNQWMILYDFLGFKGYMKCQEYHYLEETKEYIHLLHYYMKHYHKMIKFGNIPDVNLIPENWYKYSQKAVDVNTKRNAVRDAMEQWIQWEISTKSLYESVYKELVNIGEIAAAQEIGKYIEDVSNELAAAEEKQLCLATHNYMIDVMLEEQDELVKKYKGR